MLRSFAKLVKVFEIINYRSKDSKLTKKISKPMGEQMYMVNKEYLRIKFKNAYINMKILMQIIQLPLKNKNKVR